MRISKLPLLVSLSACVLVASVQATAAKSSRRRAERDYCGAFRDGTLSGDSLLVLVNKRPGNRLDSEWAPTDLVEVPSRLVIPRRTAKLRREAARNLRKLMRAARRQRLKLRVRSAYRSYKAQCAIYAKNVRRRGRAYTRRVSALPGRSQHQLGTSVDFTTRALDWKLSQRFADTREGKWLAKNAWRYGFVIAYPEGAKDITGYIFEPWHYRYVGRRAAREMKKHGLILEEYLTRCAKSDRKLRCPGAPSARQRDRHAERRAGRPSSGG